ncbi:MAG: phosphoribosylformylglycinamidine synthase subunit PurL [Acidobacteria bacterium]|nr:MAG: phosphoribosylformylglycinamidine synthase subunit PurL [Acidobacteriota bacterium]
MVETAIKVTPEIVAEHGITPKEYARIQKILGREPNFTELGIFSVMWSEHCSYKSSRIHLQRLPTHAPQVLQGPGENAGVVDVGDGLAAVFKMESHNHPSYVEPFQGAATGVGGILRDVFTMGARPIAVLDSLRFGSITSAKGISANGERPEVVARNRRLVDGVVRGIAFYGNCFGVPTVGGEVEFEPGYAGNPLVNVLALGIAPKNHLFFARARGEGNPVIYVGAKTGRDGIHGASLLASAEFTEESQKKRPNVQVGDPFLEKLLLEACLEAMASGTIVGIQDMGAAGLTSSSCEMASRGGVGIELELDRVPQRESGMTAYEMMLSESQERMLLVAERGREAEVFRVFRKWGLDAIEIGRVTSDGMLRVLHHGQIAAEIPADALAEQAPLYQRPLTRPKPSPAREARVSLAPVGTDLSANFHGLLAAPAIASKRWIFEQYDHMVRTNTTVFPGAADAAVVRLKGTSRALALATDGKGRWCALDPRVGAMQAVAEAARNVAAVGARPWAATNCLNFGNPEKPEVMWQFSEAVDGMAEACRALSIPITGGNVSFYNDTLGKSIDPTPIVGVLGVIENAAATLTMAFRNEGDAIVLLDGRGNASATPKSHERESLREFASSEYARTVAGIVGGVPPAVDLAAELRLIEALVALAAEGILASAHDISDGGIAVALAECGFASNGLAAEAAWHSDAPAELALFAETGARAVVSLSQASLARLLTLAAKYSIAALVIGRVTRGQFQLSLNGATVVRDRPASLRKIWSGAIEHAILGEQASKQA